MILLTAEKLSIRLSSKEQRFELPPPRNAELQDTDGGIDQLFSIDKDNVVAGNDKIFGGNGKEIFKAGHGNGCDIIEGFIDEQDLIFSGVNSLEASSDNSDNDSLIIR